MGRVEHPLGLEQERAFTGAVASFTDPDSLGTAGEYAATIDWGDATSATAATISQPGGPGNVFVVSGSHTYAEEGPFTAAATITDVDTPNNAATATSTATVSDAALGAGPASSVAATEGIGFAGPVGTFTDDNGGATADFVARIDWGDGTMSAGAVSGPMGGRITVSGSHIYVDEGTYTIAVGVQDDGGSTAILSGTATVADASLAATGNPNLLLTNPVSGTLATFTDVNPLATTAEFTATNDIHRGSHRTDRRTIHCDWFTHLRHPRTRDGDRPHRRRRRQ
jgi:hypothetical protein